MVISESPPHKSNAQSKREQKRRPKPKDGTMLFCGVCGDRALGYNFDAISCESCKAFFRRNALKSKPFTCSFEGNCKLDAHTRKFCSGCRLKKCFTIGMKKEWILNEDQLVKRRKRQQARQTHIPGTSTTDIQPCSSTSNDLLGEDGSMPYLPHEYPPSTLPHHQHLLPSSTCHSGSDSSDYMPLTPMGYYDSRSSSVSSPLKRHYSMSYGGSGSPTSTTSPSAHLPHHIPEPSPSSQHSPHMSLESTTKIPKLEYTSDDDDCYYGNVTRGPVSRMAATSRCQEPVNRMTPVSHLEPMGNMSAGISYQQESVGSTDELSDCSAVKSEAVDENEDYVIPLDPYVAEHLRNLRSTYDEIFEAAYTHDQIPKLTEKPKTANQLFNMTDVFIRRLIRFAKHIPEFKNLSQSDQIHLLKGGIMEMFVLRSAMGFDSKNNGWKFKVQQPEPSAPKMEGKVDSTVINTLSTSMFMQHVEFVKQLQEVSCKDRMVLMLLFIIELMSPDRANLSDKQQVSKSQERHSMWLKAYLESVHTVAESKVIYPKLLMKLMDVRNLGEESCQMASHLDITNLEPLLVEVFDLNR